MADTKNVSSPQSKDAARPESSLALNNLLTFLTRAAADRTIGSGRDSYRSPPTHTEHLAAQMYLHIAESRAPKKPHTDSNEKHSELCTQSVFYTCDTRTCHACGSTGHSCNRQIWEFRYLCPPCLGKETRYLCDFDDDIGADDIGADEDTSIDSKLVPAYSPAYYTTSKGREHQTSDNSLSQLLIVCNIGGASFDYIHSTLTSLSTRADISDEKRTHCAKLAANLSDHLQTAVTAGYLTAIQRFLLAFALFPKNQN